MNKQEIAEAMAKDAVARLNTDEEGNFTEISQKVIRKFSLSSLKWEQKKHKHKLKQKRYNHCPRGGDKKFYIREADHCLTRGQHRLPPSVPLSSYERWFREWNMDAGTGIKGKRKYKLKEHEYYMV